MSECKCARCGSSEVRGISRLYLSISKKNKGIVKIKRYCKGCCPGLIGEED